METEVILYECETMQKLSTLCAASSTQQAKAFLCILRPLYLWKSQAKETGRKSLRTLYPWHIAGRSFCIKRISQQRASAVCIKFGTSARNRRQRMRDSMAKRKATPNGVAFFWQRMRDSNLVLKIFYVVKTAFFLHYLLFSALFILKSPFSFHCFHSRKGKNKGKFSQKTTHPTATAVGCVCCIGFQNDQKFSLFLLSRTQTAIPVTAIMPNHRIRLLSSPVTGTSAGFSSSTEISEKVSSN